MCPPISLKPKWFENFTAYTIAKFGMSMCVIGMSALKHNNPMSPGHELKT